MGVVYNRSLNVFTGTVNSNFSNPNNWTGRYVPSASDAAFINANCVFDIDRTIGALIVGTNATASIGSGRTLIVTGSVNVQGHLSASGNPSIYFRGAKNVINSINPGTSTVFYDAGYDQVVARGPYYSLTIAGSSLTNTKTPSSNLVISGNLRINAFSTFELGRYDLDVIGTTQLLGTGQALRKSSGGNIIFRGNLVVGPASTNNTTINFSGNPAVEFKGGFNWGDGAVFNFNPGTNTFTFSENNQSINNYNPGGLFVFTNPIIISSSVVSITTGPVQFNSTVNGTNSNSVLRVVNEARFAYSGSIMPVGVLDYTSSAVSTVAYIYNGDGQIPYGNYSILGVGGTGTKTPSTNLNIRGLRFYNGPVVFDLGNYNLQVSGSTTLFGSNNEFRKSGPGSIVFSGSVNLLASSNNFTFNYSGNPTIEYRAGMSANDTYNTLSNTGTGSWIFSTTPNQNIDLGFTQVANFSASILISGSVRLNLANVPPGVFHGTINGTTTESIFSIPASTTFNYRNAQQPMLTGSLYASASANTVIYSLSGSQFIATPSGSIYRNLTLAGSGSKILTGNVSVQNTFTTSSLITLVTGSYTITNP